MKKLIIVDNLTPYNLFFLLIYRVFGFKVIYLTSSFLRDKSTLIPIFESVNIKSIDYSTLKSYDFEHSFNLPYKLAIEVHDKLIREKDYQLLNSLFDIKSQKKSEIALIDMIRKYIGNLSDLIICADYYKQEYSVSLWYKRNFIKNYIDSEYKNLNNSIINSLDFLFLVTYKIYKIIFVKIKSKFFRKNIKSESEIKSKQYNSSSVIYFPHKGLKAANAYEKNFFYSDDITSPFHQKNIEHIEYGLLNNTQEYKDIEADYLKKELNYRFIPRIAINSMLSFSFQFIKKTKVLPISSQNILILSLFINVKYYLGYLQTNKNTKVAIVGYDYLFPKALALTLDILKIHTVAYQERYLSAFVGLGSVSIDTYFMWNDVLKRRMDKSKLSFIGESIPLGCVKIDLFDIKSHESMVDIKTKYKKIIVALDYHSVNNSFDNQKIPIANWKNNLIFYRDLIKLAVSFPDVYIIIRGKNDEWCDMEIFSDIYNIIQEIDNIEVNRDFDRFNVSYQLVKDSDLVIGRYTSLMEESLAYGVPAISCDYGCNFHGSIERMYDGDSCFKFVSSYDELKISVSDILNNREIVNSECVDLLYKTIENPKKIIIKKIENILESKQC